MTRHMTVQLLIAGCAMVAMIVSWQPGAASAASGTAAGSAVTATVRTEANLRAEPNTTSAVRAVLAAGTRVEVICWARGEATYGADQYGAMWLYLSSGGWAHSFLLTPVDVDRCGWLAVTPVPAGEAPQLPAGVVIHPPAGLSYENCPAAIAAGAAPVYLGEPGFGPHLDRDDDGIGCEWYDNGAG